MSRTEVGLNPIAGKSIVKIRDSVTGGHSNLILDFKFSIFTLYVINFQYSLYTGTFYIATGAV